MAKEYLASSGDAELGADNKLVATVDLNGFTYQLLVSVQLGAVRTGRLEIAIMIIRRQ